jgi:coenzyme F420-reducing hydrogenase alpha subunit
VDGGNYLVGPLARWALSGDRLTPLAREAAAEAGVGRDERNPFRTILVRSVELVFAADEALRLIGAYEPPERSSVEVAPRAGIGYGCSEAPRGICWHRYEIDDEGTILDAKIVPPTSQNQSTIESDLRGVVERYVELPDDELALRCEQSIRNYDPCISCATHFLKLEVDRG